MNQFPAVLIGGPPHSGKSVLVHALTLALRARHVDHYVLRATPDGEGDWSNVADQSLVQALRRKGKFNPQFVSSTISYLQDRQIPLLVDVGGRPTAEQEALFALCTHAILLVGERAGEPGRFEQDLAEWQAMLARQHVSIVAVLRSVLDGTQMVTTTEPTITATIAGLERGQIVSGTVVELLIDRVVAILTSGRIDISDQHQASAPDGLFVNLTRALHSLRPGASEWLPADLPALATLIAADEPLAVYGRAPNWVYTQMALHAGVGSVWFFNTREGWIELPQLPLVRDLLAHEPGRQRGWFVTQQDEKEYTLLTLTRDGQNLDAERPEQLPLPEPPRGAGLVLSGQMPHWLIAAAAKALFPERQWLAVYQPHLNGAVVVWSNNPEYPLGHVLNV